jgi:hypothetical protein
VRPSRRDATLERRRNVLLAQHHRRLGWSIRQIAALLEREPATVRAYLHDPTGEKAKARKAGYAGICERCGARTSGADGKGKASPHCQRCKPQSRPRWTRETVRGAFRFWVEQFGFVPSSIDWSSTHAERRGGAALERYRSAHWPSRSVIGRLYGTWAAARADASAGRSPRPLAGTPAVARDRPVPYSHSARGDYANAAANTSSAGSAGTPGRRASSCSTPPTER